MNVKFKKVRNYGIAIVSTLIVGIFSINFYVNKKSEKYLLDNEINCPHVKYGLILGTSKYFKRGEFNSFYVNRLNAAAYLFSKRKIDKIIISGTHEEDNYSEPLSIQKDLVLKGIPDTCILLDYYGDRTILSIKNFKEQYPTDSVIIISQKFHNQRAVYLARRYGIDAWGYNASDVELKSAYKVLFREYFAKTKAVFE